MPTTCPFLRRIATCLLAMALGAAGAQAAQTSGQLIGPAGGASRTAAERATPATPASQPAPQPQAQQQPGDPVAPAALNPQPLPPRTATPAQGDDRAIIIVGGQPQPAPGNHTVKTGSRPKLWQDGSSSGRATAGAANRALAPSMPQAINAGQATAARSPSAAQRNLGGVAIQGTAANAAAAAAQIDCETPPPRISNIQGHLTPGQPFTINGMCFGKEAGAVELIGLPGGKINAQFTAWDAGSIRAVMPAVNGGTDQSVAVTVVRKSDRKASPAKEASFVAPRERVDVPAHAWSPAPRFHDAQSLPPQNGPRQGTTTFNVRVHSACALDEVSAAGTKGRVNAINGWTRNGWQARPHEASVTIPWSYACQRRETILPGAPVPVVLITGCEVDFTVSATAYCPVGISP